MSTVLTFVLFAASAHAVDCLALFHRAVALLSPETYRMGPELAAGEDGLGRVVEVELRANWSVDWTNIVGASRTGRADEWTRMRKIYGVMVKRDQNAITLFTPREEYETISTKGDFSKNVPPYAEQVYGHFIVRPATATRRLVDAGRAWRGDMKDLSKIQGHHVIVETVHGARVGEGIAEQVTAHALHLRNVREPERAKIFKLGSNFRVVDVTESARAPGDEPTERGMPLD